MIFLEGICKISVSFYSTVKTLAGHKQQVILELNIMHMSLLPLQSLLAVSTLSYGKICLDW